jgi:diguanylate cyclase (GGDEF)-like protein
MMPSTNAATGCGRSIVSVRVNDSIAHAAKVMARCNVGALIVLDERGGLAGIVSERDILRFFAELSPSPPEAPVSRIMTAGVISCSPATSLAQINRLMVERGIRHLPVMDGGKPVAMFSSRDVMAHQLTLLGEMKDGAEQMAKLVKRLRTLNVAEVLTVAGSEVPRLLGAERILIRFEDGTNPPEVFRRNCLCPAGELASGAPTADGLPVEQPAPEPCRQRGCEGQRILMPLAEARPEGAKAAAGAAANFVCLCGWPRSQEPMGEVLQYKAQLAQDILGTTLVNAMQYREAHRYGNIDALTEVCTRRVLQAGLQAEVDRGLRYGRPFCLAFLDVDRFKAINDSQGHAAGDTVLRAVAAVISASTRDCDLVARYGGDEFVIVMPETALPEALAAVERLRKAVETQVSRPDRTPITISGGVAQWEGEAKAEDLLARADLALYQVKRTGRNAVAAAAPHQRPDPEVPAPLPAEAGPT